MNKDDDFENLTEEEKVRRGMAMAGFLEFLKNNNQQSSPFENLAKLQKDLFDAYVKVGFTPEQALELLKSMNSKMG